MESDGSGQEQVVPPNLGGGEGIHNITLKDGNHARGAANQVNPWLGDGVDGVLWCSSRAVGRGVCNLVFSAGRVDPEVVQTVRSALEGKSDSVAWHGIVRHGPHR